MRLLLDTCTLLWCTDDASRLSSVASQALLDESNELFVSVVSAWEIHVKHSLNKLTLPLPPGEYLRAAISQLRCTAIPLEWRDVEAFDRTAGDHKDPFDRLLACQALAWDITIVTPDEMFDALGANRLW